MMRRKKWSKFVSLVLALIMSVPNAGIVLGASEKNIDISDPMLSVEGVFADDANKAKFSEGEADIENAENFEWYRYEFEIDPELDTVGTVGDGIGEIYFRLFVPETEEGKLYPLVANQGGLGSSNTMTSNFYAKTGMSYASEVFQKEYPGYVMTFNVPFEACVNYEAEMAYVYQLGEIMKAVNTAYGNVDMNRLYSTGLSQGAGWTYELASIQPDLLAAILINAGTTIHTTWGNQCDVEAIAESEVNIGILHGYKDPYIPVNEAYRAFNTFKKFGKTNMVMDITNNGHCIMSALSSSEITPQMEWLFQQVKGVPCVTEPEVKEEGNYADYDWAGVQVYPAIEGWSTAYDYANWIEPAENKVWDALKEQSEPMVEGKGGTGTTVLGKVRIGDETATSYDTTQTIKAGDVAAITVQGYTGGYGDDWEAFNEEWDVDWAVLEGSVTGIELTKEASKEPIVRPESVTLANGGGPNVNNSMYNENTLDGNQVYIRIDTAENFQGEKLKVALRFTRVVGNGEYASYIHVIDLNVDSVDKPDTVEKQKQVISTKSASVILPFGHAPYNLKASTTGDGKISYRSSNKKVLVVNSKGKVTIKGTGKATITITAEETDTYQKATKKLRIYVVPKKAEMSKVTAVKGGKIKIIVKKDSMASGTIVQYSTNKNFKKSVIVATAKKDSSKVVISGLKPGKNYYVRICNYVSIAGNKYCGASSKAIKVRAK